MRVNVGPGDRVLRIVLGVFLAVAAFFVGALWLKVALGVAAGIALLTGATGFCLLYVPFGIDSNRRARLHKESSSHG